MASGHYASKRTQGSNLDSLTLAMEETAEKTAEKSSTWLACEIPSSEDSGRQWLSPEAFIQTALELLASDRYLQKGMGLVQWRWRIGHENAGKTGEKM
jgi:hypothetical protein